MIGALFQGILSTSLAVSLVIAPLLIALPLLRRRYRPGVVRCVWLLLAVRLLVPILPPNPPPHRDSHWGGGFDLPAGAVGRGGKSRGGGGQPVGRTTPKASPVERAALRL